VANVCNFTLRNPSNLNCMKQLLLSIFTASLLTSCSTAFKSGQTPDDVYYSPTREIKEEEPKKQETTSNDDNYLRMKVRRHTKWANIDDYGYWNDTRYDYCSVYSNPYIKTNWYPYYFGNTFHNPYSTVITYNPIKTGSTAVSNIKAYQNHSYNNSNGTYNVKTGTYSNSNNSSFSGLVKKAFSSSNGSSWDTPTRTFNNPSSSSSSSTTTTTTSSSAGGNSGGYSSSGSSSSSGRGGRN
jgi:hypothetical protein